MDVDVEVDVEVDVMFGFVFDFEWWLLTWMCWIWINILYRRNECQISTGFFVTIRVNFQQTAERAGGRDSNIY